MNKPLDALVADLVTALNDNQREDFEERAGIIEFEAGLPRAHAECLALLLILRRNSAVLTGVTLVKVKLKGTSQWLLTTDPEVARESLAGSKCSNLAEVLQGQYGGTAKLLRLCKGC